MLPVRPVLAALVLSGLCATSSAGEQGRVEMANHDLRVILTRENGSWGETYEARSGRRWARLLTSGHARRPDPSVITGGSRQEIRYTGLQYLRPVHGVQQAELSAAVSGMSVRKVVTLREGENFAHVTVTATLRGRHDLSELLATYTALPDVRARLNPGSVFTPVLRPEEHDVIGDHVFRAPALMLQQEKKFVAVVPDPTFMNTPRARVRTAADVRVDGTAPPLIAYGLMPWDVRSHVLYWHTDSMSVTLTDTTVAFGYYVFCSSDAAPRAGYRDVVRFHWNRFGHEAFAARGGPQHEPFASYIRKAWDEYLPTVAMEAVYAGRPVTLLRQARLAWSNRMPKQADNDCWFNVWFNALRTAYGMAFYGGRSGRHDLVRQADGVLNLALSAPQQDGIAPSIFFLDSTGAGHWVADHAWGGIAQGEYLPMFHNAWTCVWLLRWADLRPARRDEILTYTGRFARFLIRNQHARGVIPSWYAPETLAPAEAFREENAETAGAALFLASYARATGDSAALTAAVKAMDYIFREILPEQKWFDFETFFSCSRKPLGYFDRYTGQHPQNTLSMHQAAEACLMLYEVTGRREYLKRGEAILDYLGLYQQVWSPRWLSCDLFGGFGVQNTDGEWSDSRQGYFAETFMRYFDATGRREYFERGVASLRAMFSLFESPSSPRTNENYAHGGRDQMTGVTGLHWGTGSSVVSIHLITARYGDAYVDAAGAWGAGIDGCRVSRVSVAGDHIRCTITDDVASHRTLRLVVGHARSVTYRVSVNGRELGRFGRESLTEGIDVPL